VFVTIVCIKIGLKKTKERKADVDGIEE